MWKSLASIIACSRRGMESVRYFVEFWCSASLSVTSCIHCFSSKRTYPKITLPSSSKYVFWRSSFIVTFTHRNWPRSWMDLITFFTAGNALKLLCIDNRMLYTQIGRSRVDPLFESTWLNELKTSYWSQKPRVWFETMLLYQTSRESKEVFNL